MGLKAKESDKSSSTTTKKEGKQSAASKEESEGMESATKAPKTTIRCLATDKKATKPQVAKVTPPKLDVPIPNEDGVQLKRPPECLDEPCSKEARTDT